MLVCLASHRATFENNCVKTNKDRHILSAMKIFGRESSIWHYKVYVDIFAGSVENRHQITVWSHVNVRLEHLFLAFKSNYVKLNADKPILLQLSYSSVTSFWQ